MQEETKNSTTLNRKAEALTLPQLPTLRAEELASPQLPPLKAEDLALPQLPPLKTEDAKILEEKPTLEKEFTLEQKLPNQNESATIKVSTINAKHRQHRTLISQTLSKSKRIENLLKKHPEKNFIFIDDTPINIFTCPKQSNIQSYLYHHTLDFTILDVLPNTTLLLDFDLTLTTTHTFSTTRQEVYDENIEHNISFNQNILNFLKIFPGDVIILTDHNNNKFVSSQTIKAIEQCNLEHNLTQQSFATQAHHR